MSTVRYVLSPLADPLLIDPPFPVTGLSPTWAFLMRTSDCKDLTADAPSISEHSTTDGVYYFDIDYSNIGGEAAAHVTGLIDWGDTVGSDYRFQEFKGAATDYSGWLEAYPITVQLYETGTTTPITDHAYLTVYDGSGEVPQSPMLEADSNGTVSFALRNGNYLIIPSSTPYITWEGLPWSVTVDGASLTITKYGTVWKPSSPSAPDTCVIYVLASDIAGVATTRGTFEVVRIVSPSTIGTGDTMQTVVKTENPVELDNNGRAEIEALQGAVLVTRFTPYNDTPIEKQITVPSAASANWATL